MRYLRVGVDSVWEQKKTRKRAESHTSGARCVGTLLTCKTHRPRNDITAALTRLLHKLYALATIQVFTECRFLVHALAACTTGKSLEVSKLDSQVYRFDCQVHKFDCQVCRFDSQKTLPQDLRLLFGRITSSAKARTYPNC